MRGSLIKRLRLLSLAAGLVAAAAPALAQAPSSTGVNVSGGQDQMWQVQYTNTSAPSGSGFFNAFVVQNPPGVWQPNTSSYQWISASSSGSLGLPSTYTYQTTFNLTGFNPNTAAFVFQCAVDNTFVSISLNGNVTTTSCGSGNTTNFQFGAPQTLTSGFVSGVNTLTVNSGGDGQTDGFVLSVIRFNATPTSTVPEPSSLALLGTGLMGLVSIVRRRRH